MRKVLLNKNKSIKNVNDDIIIPIDINRDYSLIQDEQKVDTVDTFELYQNEKNDSTKHRFIFTINPVCTNVLFNYVTEIVYKEGSDECKILDDKESDISELKGAIGKKNPKRIEAIRNTEYSNDKFKLKYHCGVDIFNNHLLRKKENISIQPSTGVNEDFNTIRDYCRNKNGDNIKIKTPSINTSYTYSGNTGENNARVYNFDTIDSFIDGFKKNISRENGWLGFYNPSTLYMPVSGDINSNGAYYVNKCINNADACQFIDLTPERDLFYFTPKKNTYRHRLEYNWDYCLTYPSESIYKDDKILIGKGKGLPIQYIHPYISNNNISLLSLYSPVNHNLKVNDNIKLMFTNDNGESYEYKCTVIKIGFSTLNGNENNRFFSIRKDDIFNDINLHKISNVRFVKLYNNTECDYYYRKFTKISPYFKSNVNKLAFSKNIYGDEISQIIFTDDVNIENLNDNLGRPLSEVYLTILKRNQGYKEWYESGITSSDTIEYSHIFGEVTSGIDIPVIINDDNVIAVNKIPENELKKEDGTPYYLVKVGNIFYKWVSWIKGEEDKSGYQEYYYSYVKNDTDLPIIRKQHNINHKDMPKPISSKKIETGITISYDSFYGDLIEFNPITISETVLEDVKHRFNTAQRELVGNDIYSYIYHDEIDDEDDDGDIKVTTKILTVKSGNTDISATTFNPEGYIYKPHYKVKIGEFSDIVKQRNNSKIFINDFNIQTTGLTTNINEELINGERLIFFDKENTPILFKVKSYKRKDGGEYLIELDKEINPININSKIHKINGNLFIYRVNKEVPSFASFLPGTTGVALWRDVIKPSNYSYGSDLYTTPFSNGAFYHHTNIIFPVRRQDPFAEFGIKNSVKSNNNNFDIQPADTPDVLTDSYSTYEYNNLCI